jgi:hypothetical protein
MSRLTMLPLANASRSGELLFFYYSTQDALRVYVKREPGEWIRRLNHTDTHTRAHTRERYLWQERLIWQLLGVKFFFYLLLRSIRLRASVPFFSRFQLKTRNDNNITYDEDVKSKEEVENPSRATAVPANANVNPFIIRSST